MRISDMCPIPRSSIACGEQPCAAFKDCCPGRLIAKSSRATIQLLRFRFQGLGFSRRGFRARVQGLQLMLFRVCASGFLNGAPVLVVPLSTFRYHFASSCGPTWGRLAGSTMYILTSTNSPATDQL